MIRFNIGIYTIICYLIGVSFAMPQQGDSAKSPPVVINQVNQQTHSTPLANLVREDLPMLLNTFVVLRENGESYIRTDIATPEYRVEHDSSEGIVPFDITFTFPSFLTLLRATDALRYISGYTLKEESQEARPAREFDPSTGKWQVRFSLDVVADADSGDSSQLMGSISVFDQSGHEHIANVNMPCRHFGQIYHREFRCGEQLTRLVEVGRQPGPYW